jgi:type III secretion protein V
MLAARMEAIIAMAVVGVIFLMVLPIPHQVMDVLIATNLFIAGLLIVLAMYVKGLTSFSTFPVVLLLSTLLRLGISIATTRMILLTGDAGAIIETFGNFVVGGNLVVGLVVFLIVTVVNFIVVTKGSERVAEVSARFCLDAMPAKQLAIESELRANLIDQAEAKRLRSLLDIETQLLGAMDGAMKFVKGDSIASLIIVFVNLLGGLTIGMMMRGMSAGQAIRAYSVLSIGDGLVSQIPALLTSMTAAILVTRINGAEGRAKGMPFGVEMISQMRHQKALWTVSVVMGCFALIPGMPTVVFLVLAGISGAIAYYIGLQGKEEESTKEEAKAAKSKEVSVIHEFNQMDGLQLALPATARSHPGVDALTQQVFEARNRLVLDYGMTLPAVAVKYDPTLPDGQLEFRVYEVPVLRAPIRFGQMVVVGRYAEAASRLPDATVEHGAGIARTDLVWLPVSALDDEPRIARASTRWAVHLGERVLQKLLMHGPRFTGIQAAQKYINWMDGWMPELSKELQKAMPASKLADVLQRLLRERVAIRNMRIIMETLADHGQRERDTAALAELVRFALREQICHQIAPGGQLDVIVLAPELEEQLAAAIRQTANGGFLALNPDEAERIGGDIRAAIAQHHEADRVPALVCGQDIRRYVRTLLEADMPELVVLSLNEITTEVAANVLATVEMAGSDQYA